MQQSYIQKKMQGAWRYTTRKIPVRDEFPTMGLVGDAWCFKNSKGSTGGGVAYECGPNRFIVQLLTFVPFLLAFRKHRIMEEQVHPMKRPAKQSVSIQCIRPAQIAFLRLAQRLINDRRRGSGLIRIQ